MLDSSIAASRSCQIYTIHLHKIDWNSLFGFYYFFTLHFQTFITLLNTLTANVPLIVRLQYLKHNNNNKEIMEMNCPLGEKLPCLFCLLLFFLFSLLFFINFLLFHFNGPYCTSQFLYHSFPFWTIPNAYTESLSHTDCRHIGTYGTHTLYEHAGWDRGMKNSNWNFLFVWKSLKRGDLIELN